MRLPSFVPKIAPFLCFFLSCAAAAASPNLTGRLLPVSRYETAEGFQGIAFEIEVRNAGDAVAAGTLRIKPFLVARDDVSGAVVLDNLDAPISIGPGMRATLEYRAPLPLLAQRDWWLGAVINPDWAIEENGPGFRYDNTPDLVPFARVAVTRAPPVPATGYDLYPRVVDSNQTGWGSITHALRAIVRATSGEIDFPSSALRALFGTIDFATRRVSLLDYNRGADPEDPEKAWYAIAWHPEKGAAGNDVLVDYYSNNILFGHVPPGKYRFFTLMNSRDLVPEGNRYDNLETIPLDLSLAEFPRHREILAGGTAGTEVSRAIPIRGMYPGAVGYAARLVSDSPALNRDLGAGSLSEEGTIELRLPALPVGAYSARLVVEATLPAGNGNAAGYVQRTELPVRYAVRETETPALTVSAAQLGFFAHQERDSEAQTLVLSNPGPAFMRYSLAASKPWISLSSAEGALAPGETATISVRALATANLGQVSTSYAEGSIFIHSDRAGEMEPTLVQVSIETRN